MKPRLVELLACPDCEAPLALASTDARDGDEILEGALACTGCHRSMPILRGVPRLLPTGVDALAAEVADSFGWEWNHFDELRPEYRQQFLDWIAPLGEADFAGKVVLEGGCGKGRHSSVVAGFGARDVLSVDLGSAVEAAYKNTRHLAAVHVIQGDIAQLPVRRDVADVAFSVGVLHHMPDPLVGFRALVEHTRPGGQIAVWVYGREGNEWIVDYVDPVRTRVTSRLPRRALYEATRPLAWLVAAASHGVYGPLARAGTVGKRVHEHLFYKDYLTYIARLPLREIHSIVFDQLVTPVAHYLAREDVERFLDDERLVDTGLARHNGNSWRAHARVAGHA